MGAEICKDIGRGRRAGGVFGLDTLATTGSGNKAASAEAKSHADAVVVDGSEEKEEVMHSGGIGLELAKRHVVGEKSAHSKKYKHSEENDPSAESM